MPRFFFILISILLPAIKGYTQTSVANADSLKTAIKNPALPDTSKAWLLLQLTKVVFTSAPEEAMEFVEEALVLSEKQHWDKGIAYSWLTKGGIHYLQSDYLAALDCFLKALDSKELSRSKIFKSKIHNNLANVYADLKQYDKSLAYYFESLSAALASGEKEDQATSFGNIGTIYHTNKKYDSAQYYYKRALDLAEALGNKRLISNILCTTGALLKETGKYRESVLYSEKSIALARESDNDYVLAPALNNLASAYLSLNKYDKAEQLSRESLEVATKLGGVQWQSEAWEALFTLYEKQGKYKKALDAHKTFISLRDSIMNDEKKQEITRLELQYENDKKNAVISTQHQAEIRRQNIIRNSIAVGSGILLLAGGLIFLFYKKRRDAEFKKQIVESDIKVMRLQMNPHFIFNSLNSIREYIAKNNSAAAEDYLNKFARIMRQTLENSAYKEIPLMEDIKNLDLYMSMESLRLNKKFTYEIIIDNDIDRDITLVPPMILQPYVENSIWHGIAKKDGVGKIVVMIKKSGEMLRLIVEDDGIGRQQTGKSEKQSMGMQITQGRIDIINKLKNSNAAVKLFDKQPGTKVELMLPLELRF